MNPHTSQNWAAVPGHLLQIVFAKCSVIDRISSERVCSHWKNAMSYADITMIDLKVIFPKIKKQDSETSDCEEEQSFCVIQPSALAHCLDFLNKRKRITRLTCSPVDSACGKYSCLMHIKLPYLPGFNANELLHQLAEWDTNVRPAKYWMLDMNVLGFLARECGDTLESLDLTHCAVDDPTLATLHSHGFPKLVEYFTSGVNENADDTALCLNFSSFPALKSLSFTMTASRYATVLPIQLTTLRLIQLAWEYVNLDFNSLCLLEQCPNLVELYLINFYFIEQQFKNKGFRLEHLKTLCFKQTSFANERNHNALTAILSVAPALHTFYWGIAATDYGCEPQNASNFDPPEMFKSTRNLKVLGLSCTDIPDSRLVDLLICFPHLQALSLHFYSSQSLNALSKALAKGALQLEELNLLSHFNPSLKSLSDLPNLKRIRFGYRFTSGVTAAALSELPTTVNQVRIDDCSTSRVLRIPPDCSDRSSLFANFLTRSTSSEQNNIKRTRNSGSGDPGDEDCESSIDCDSDDATSKKPRKEI